MTDVSSATAQSGADDVQSMLTSVIGAGKAVVHRIGADEIQQFISNQYYGDQPFKIGGFPIIWLVINSPGSLLAAVVITRLSWFFTGTRQLLAALVPFATYMASWD